MARRVKRRPEFWAAVLTLEVLAVLLLVFGPPVIDTASAFGFVLGALALYLRLHAAREAKFLRSANRVPAEVIAVNLPSGRFANRRAPVEVEYRYRPDGQEALESRAQVDSRRLGRISPGEMTDVFVDGDRSGRVRLESELIFHRTRKDERR